MAKNRSGTSPLVVINVVVIIALIALSGFLFYKYQDAQDQVVETPEQEVSRLVSEVNEIYQLPAGETPSVATIQDLEALSGQAFFENAQNGDKLLIYEQARQAFLYRESIKKVINAGPIAISQDTDGLSTSEETPQPQQEAEPEPQDAEPTPSLEDDPVDLEEPQDAEN